ncbi:LLM class flavin-dependent oxidoreductase [Aureisphaera galaxeae]|uniref:LLM class flavin-dependent oxidoreductase n=1 Tax=Aureisphaera galaxeae TaxID=1538023 RepID=UPI00235060D9|nr:LLM class flavin-dependent oxidoreductase [Aureisphaera galaxeae]MDC8005423.1 LLM class flavin-dependent oxidoreductase [Aureisphaera galaxeae]
MTNAIPLRFHWTLSQAGDNLRASGKFEGLTGLLDFQEQLKLCKKAEENGIDSVLMAIGFTRPDPLMLATALGLETERIKFLVAVRSGLITPAYFVQQMNTASHLIGDRLYINVVSGHTPSELRYYGDFKEKEERNERTREFMELCHAFWEKGSGIDYKGTYYQVENGAINTPFNSEKRRPTIYISGNSERAVHLVSEYGDCLWRFPDTPEVIAEKIQPLAASGKGAGLLTSIIARPTQEEAEHAAQELLKNFINNNKGVHKNYEQRYDSEGFREILDNAFNNDSHWLTPYLWNGAVPYLGAPSIALVGSYETVANALMEYKRAGITQFLFIGWPDIEEVVHFGQGVLPLVRGKEVEQMTSTV